MAKRKNQMAVYFPGAGGLRTQSGAFVANRSQQKEGKSKCGAGLAVTLLYISKGKGGDKQKNPDKEQVYA